MTKLYRIKNDIDNFKSLMKSKYDVDIVIDFNPVVKSHKLKLSLKDLHTLVKHTAVKYDPDILENVVYFNTRLRRVINYSHSFIYIAHKLGYKKIQISAYLKKNHATIINSIKKAEDLITINESDFMTTYQAILNTYNQHVGATSENIKAEHNT